MDYIVDITVTDIQGKGTCSLGHTIGDIFHIGDGKLCPWAQHTLMPFATALRLGGTIPWKETKTDEIEIGCPDPENVVVFKLTRHPKDSGTKLGW